jgi:predicted nuclease with TOPRIM domain
MENDYKSDQSTHDSTINEMEKRMVDLRSNVDRLQQMKQKLDDEKNFLVKNNEQLQLQVKIFHRILFVNSQKSLRDGLCKKKFNPTNVQSSFYNLI